MVVPASLIVMFGLIAVLFGIYRFWRETRGSINDLFDPPALLGAMADAVVVRFQQGGEDKGCYYPGENASRTRWILHLCVFWGFCFAFAATLVAFIYQDFLGLLPPYPILSAPVLLGSIGGVGMIIGATGLIYLKMRSDPAPADATHTSSDYVLLVVIDLAAITGMLLLVMRATPAMGSLLIIHLAVVLVLFVTAPYGKLVHFVYRYLALVQNRIESKPGKMIPKNEKETALW
jgi:citrate/tricarballylate utilization protein